MATYSGTIGNDTLYGGSGNDLFNASAGNDSIYGYDGTDRAVYSLNISNYRIRFVKGIVEIVKPDGFDQLFGIEQISFGSSIFQINEVAINPLGGWSYPMDIDLGVDGSLYFLSSNGGNQKTLSIVKPDLTSFQNFSVSSGGFSIFDFDDNLNGLIFSTGSDINGAVDPIGPAIYQADDLSGIVLRSAINLGFNVSTSLISKFENLGISEQYWTVGLTASNVDQEHLGFSVYKVGLGDYSASQLFTISEAYADVSACELSNGNYLVAYFKQGSVVFDPVRGSSYYDTRIQASIVSGAGETINTLEVGGSAQISDAYLTSSKLNNGKIFVGWIGLDHVLDPNGGISSGGGTYSQYGYFHGVLFDPENPAGYSNFQINQNPQSNAIWTTSCALTGGGFAVVWASNDDGSGCGIFGRIYDANGLPIGDQFQVNTQIWGNQTKPIICSDNNGGFVCYWNNESTGGVYQRFDQVGNPLLLNITGTSAADIIFTEAGDQQIIAGAGNDQVDAGLGNDIIIAGDGADTLTGGAGNDIVSAGAGNDLIIGGSGPGDDTYRGGAGIDTVRYTSALDGIVVNLTTGVATSRSSGDPAGIGTDTISEIENVIAGNYDDFIAGSDVANNLQAGSGNDTLDGARGVDTLIGGSGNDSYYVDLTAAGALQDTVTEASSGGTDTLILRGLSTNTTVVTRSLPTNFENIDASATETSLMNFTGNSVNNSIIGNDAANVITGGGGTDSLYGNGSNDIFILVTLTDYTSGEIIDGGGGIDEIRITTSSSGTVTLNASLTSVENIVIGTGTGVTASTSGTTAISVNASVVGYGLTITGNNGANTLTGTSFGDTLYGNNGNDRINGGVGKDRIYGGLGNDRLTGGTEADSFVFNTTPNSSSNRDTITDFEVGVDKIELAKSIFTGFGSLGPLSDVAFWSNTTGAAHDADDRIIYNSSTGALFYDSNGNGTGGPVPIATLTAGLALTYSDFLII